MVKRLTKQEKSWIIYDWGHSAYTMIIIAVWWLVFSLPLLKNVHQGCDFESKERDSRGGLGSLWETVKEIKNNKPLLLFLLAYFFYIGGLDTIIIMMIAYGKALHLETTTLVLILLLTQFVAVPSTLFYGWLAKKIGTKKTIVIGIITCCIICVVAFFMGVEKLFTPMELDGAPVWHQYQYQNLETMRALFVALAVLGGTAQGGIQALSRSYFAGLAPRYQASRFFGVYHSCRKLAILIWPALFGGISLWTGKANYGISATIILFIIGAVLFQSLESISEKK